VAQVSVGGDHACARLTNGQAVCWGRNTDGRLGDGTTTDRLRPVVVLNGLGSGPLTGVTQLSAGVSHTCARLTSGRVACWGGNSHGQAGGGGGAVHTLPSLVLSNSGVGALEDVAQVSAGRGFTCARKDNGQVRCWGANDAGELGDGTHIDRVLPQPVVGPLGIGRLTGVAQLATGDDHSCVRLANGQARCWGSGGEGELATGEAHGSTAPVTPELANGSPVVNVAQVAVGTHHTCFRLESGRVRCAGADYNDQLGNPDTDDFQLTPLLVRAAGNTGPLEGVVQIALGGSHTCSRHVDGIVACWGANFAGQLGDGGGAGHPQPVAVQI
jgi:alpha-tubulin suppressor-like RCC1 family protein